MTYRHWILTALILILPMTLFLSNEVIGGALSILAWPAPLVWVLYCWPDRVREYARKLFPSPDPEYVDEGKPELHSVGGTDGSIEPAAKQD